MRKAIAFRFPPPRCVLVKRLVRHPSRPVAGDLFKFADGHFSIRVPFLATFHGVPARFGRLHESRKEARHVG